MNIKEYKCENCGSKLNVNIEENEMICPNCGSVFIINETNMDSENSIVLDDGIYYGNSLSGQPNGYGVCQYKNGNKYEGEWQAGGMNGHGEYTFQNSKKWIGEFKNNQFWNGKGFLQYDGFTYEGEYKNGMWNGHGILKYDDGKEWSGEWVNGKEYNGTGDLVFYNDDGKTGQVYTGKLVNGIPQDDGEWHFNGYWEKYDICNDVLVAYYGTSEILDIPLGVHRIEKRFSVKDDIREITLPKTIEKIEKNTFQFYDEPLIERISGEGLTAIPNEMFKDWTKLKSAEFTNVKNIGKYSFENCCELQNINMPSVEIIDEFAFYNCTQVVNVSFPTTKIIEEHAFYGCDKLENILLPQIKVLKSFVFQDCLSLKVFESQTLEEFYNGALIDCDNLVAINCPKAEYIEGDGYVYEFDYGCPKLQKVILADEVCWSKEVKNNNTQNGCYIATAVYGSYNCPEVWTLRRYRDYILAKTWKGRAFIKIYYTISPTIVRWFGDTKWFKEIWKYKLDRIVLNLQSEGIESTPYEDIEW